MSVKLTKTSDGISLNIEKILDRKGLISSYLVRHVYPKYKAIQEQRWMTENDSEGDTWLPVKEPYSTRKQSKFLAFPGQGSKTMIATGQLFTAATGKGPGKLAIFDDNSMTVGVEFSPGSGFTAKGNRKRNKNTGELTDYPPVTAYSAYPALIRPFMTFSDNSIQRMTDGLAQYVMTGREE